MNHQSFEHWILEGEAPPADQADWSAPEPGFSHRWLQRWQAEQARQQERKTFWLAILSSLAFLVLTILLVRQGLPVFAEPSSLVVGLVNAIVGFSNFIVVAFRVSSSLFRVTPSSVWLALASMLSVFSLLSVLALNRFVLQKGALR